MLAAAGILAWRAKTRTVLARTYFAAIISAALLFPGFLSYWSLFVRVLIYRLARAVSEFN